MKKIGLLIIVVAMFVSACGGAQPNLPDTNALSTQIAATVKAAFNSVTTSVPQLAATAKPIVPPAATQAPANPPPNSTASFSPITFAIGVENEQPVDAMDTFPSGVTKIYGVFSGINIKDGQAWRHEWLLNGESFPELSSGTTWKAAIAGVNSVWWITPSFPEGMDAGEWELRLYIGDQLVQSGKVTVEANVEPDFGPITFAGGVDTNDQPVDPVTVRKPTFAAGTKEVYAFFSGINVTADTDWQSEWFFNGKSLDSKNHAWNLSPNEENWIQFGSTSSSPLTPGTYELKLTIDGTVVNIGSFVVLAN
ncbi:MAG TPA: hypothetical protein VFF70_09895 [Anaerolineae bacterium]|nr:hypothetical protein [Anaerolineae bacterium]